MEKEGSQKEQAEQDLAHIAALETEIERARGICLLLEARLQESSADVTTTVTENNSIKRLFEAVGVMRDDFNMESCADEPARKRRMTETGRRLIKNLGGEPPAAVAEPDAGRWVPTNQGQTPAPPAPMSARPVVTPPAAFPVESQVAAAALTLAKGNPAGALLSLLQKALSARVPMQSSQPADGQGQMHQAAVVQAAPVTAVL